MATSARASSAEASLVRSIGTFGLAASIVNVTIATWQLRRRDVRAGGIPFKVPAPGLVIVLACLVIGWMLTSVTLGEWAAFGVAVVAATTIFAFRRKSLATPVT